jgi:ParB/RepB/Spo0J family partition protein
MPYYIVKEVRVSAGPQVGKTGGQSVTVPRTLEQLGFKPKAGKSRNDMDEGAEPVGNIVVRYEKDGNPPWFKIIGVDRKGAKAVLTQIDAGRVLDADENGLLKISGPGSKLKWQLDCDPRQLSEAQINIRGNVMYDTGKRVAVAPRTNGEKRERATVVQATTHVRSVASVPPTNPVPVPAAPVVTPPSTLDVKEASAVIQKLADRVEEVGVDEIVPDPTQPREYFDRTELHSTANSMEEESQVVAIIVRPLTTPVAGKKYMIVDGERRWRSAQLVGLKTLLVIVRCNLDDRKAFRHAVVANFNKVGHTTGECLKVIKRLLADGCTVAETCKLCGKSASWYYKLIAYEKLHPDLMKLIDPPTERKHRLPGGIAKNLAYLPLDAQLPAYHRILQEPSRGARTALSAEIALPYVGESNRNKPSDHLRSLERFILALRGANKRSFAHVESAVGALFNTKSPEQIEVLLQTIEETIGHLSFLRQMIVKKRQNVVTAS